MVELPVDKYKDQIKDLLHSNQVLIVCAETGSGKSTRIPCFFPERNVIVTEPRKVAAEQIAVRIAEEADLLIGENVGFAYRNKEVLCDSTKLLFCTDGWCVSSKKYEMAEILILDEVHMQTKDTEFLIALFKKKFFLQSNKKLILMSGTLDSDKYVQYFLTSCATLKCSGRTFPVETFFVKERLRDVITAIADLVAKLHCGETTGDILVFLDGKKSIAKCVSKIQTLLDSLTDKAFKCIPFMAGISSRAEKEIFSPFDGRKIIIATNVAETSLTLENLVFVIDSGLKNKMVYNSSSRTRFLKLSPISKMSALQRQGRVGRISNGICFRMYTQKDYDEFFPETEESELQNCPLEDVILLVKSLGFRGIYDLPWFNPPQIDSVLDGIFQLHRYKAIDGNCELTEDGKKMVQLSVELHHGKMLLSSLKFDCLPSMASIVALLSARKSVYEYIQDDSNARKIRKNRKSLVDARSEHITLYNIFEKFVAVADKQSWCAERGLNLEVLQEAVKMKSRIMHKFFEWNTSCSPDFHREALLAAICNALSHQVARRETTTHYRWNNNRYLLDPGTQLDILEHKAVFVVFDSTFVKNNQNYLQVITNCDYHL